MTEPTTDTGTVRRWTRGIGALVLVLVVLVAALVFSDSTGDRQKLTERASRVLVISLPYTSWSDLDVAGLDNLTGLLDQSAIATLTTRTIGNTDLEDGYLTMSAGTRATGGLVATDGAAFNTDEEFGRELAGDVFERQVGREAADGIVHLGLSAILDANEEEDVNPVIGTLGKTLRDAGYARAVIANGDGSSPVSAYPEYQRMAAAALMGPDGFLPGGRVDDGLLTDDPDAPYGLRYDLDAVTDAFDSVWKDKSVVLVETSDLVRAARYQPFSIKGQRRVLFKEALRASDRLIGRLLEEVDFDRDAIIVVSPVPSALGEELTVLSVRAPGVDPGYLRSPALRRPGFVPIVDVAPTILELLGVDAPTEIRGRPSTVVANDKTAVERREYLVDEIAAADFRDEILNPVIIAFVVIQAAIALGAFLVLRGRWGDVARRRVRRGALAALGFVTAAYLARLIPFHEAKPAYPVFLILASFALAAIYQRLGRRNEVDPLIIALGSVVALMVIDVVLGAHLQLDSAFGYGPTVGVRISGFGNISYAVLSASALLLAGLVAHRIGGHKGVDAAIAILVLALVVDTAPFWGADAGGVLSMVPAFGVATALLLGKRVRAGMRTVLLCVAAVAAGLVIAAAIDLSRPEADRTHLGRFVEQVRDEGFSTVTTTLAHKLDQTVATIVGVWGLMLPPVLAFLLFLKIDGRRFARLFSRIPEMRAILVGFTILAALGAALNDSGINIPGMMLGILNAVLVVLVVRANPSDDDVEPAVTTSARSSR